MHKNNSTLIIFPSLVFSGHEKMATKHFLTSENQIFFPTSLHRHKYKHSILFYFKLIRLRHSFSKVLLINGSPFGRVTFKIFLKFLNFYVIEYTPFPELPEMKDKFFHGVVAYLNKYLVDVRILIDDWQVNFSKVSVNYVVKNYV